MQHITTSAALKHVFASKPGLVIVKATATWCPPCQRAAPIVDGFARKYTATTFLHLDVDEAPELTQELKVSAMPTFIFFKGGKEFDRLQGADLAGVEQRIKQHGMTAPTPEPKAAPSAAASEGPSLVGLTEQQIKAMSISQLKAALVRHKIDISDCIEKTDLIAKALKLAS